MMQSFVWAICLPPPPPPPPPPNVVSDGTHHTHTLNPTSHSTTHAQTTLEPLPPHYPRSEPLPPAMHTSGEHAELEPNQSPHAEVQQECNQPCQEANHTYDHPPHDCCVPVGLLWWGGGEGEGVSSRSIVVGAGGGGGRVCQ